MRIDRKTLTVALVAFVVGSWTASSGRQDSKPEPLEDRPVLRWIAKTAKSLLWVAMFAEEPPEEQTYVVSTRTDDHGQRSLNHGRGW